MLNLDLPKDIFDFIIVGTDLTEMIVAASLAKAGKSILVIDQANAYSGHT
jgi:RAB protein geranylgeranyltransferase component A